MPLNLNMTGITEIIQTRYIQDLGVSREDMTL